MRRRAPGAALAALLLPPLLAGSPGVSRAMADGPVSVSIDRAEPAQGDVVRVELRGAPSPDNASIHWRGRAWPMKGCGPGCFETYAGVDLAEAPGRHTISILGSRDNVALRADVEVEVRGREFPVQSFTVPVEREPADPALLERVESEAAALRERFGADPSHPAWESPFLPPVPGFAPTGFGARRIVNGEPRNPHTGGDMPLPEGVPVRAVADGRVVFSGEQFFGGNQVVIDHGGGLFSMYFHLAERAVEEGRAVLRGDRVGTVGSTGRATGPHLHFGLRVTGARVDPAALPGVVDNR